MISTPIVDFAKAYAQRAAVRMHMPGHKGKQRLGCEPWDLTEISGADDLYHAQGIIAQSERNASFLFGCDTYYSTEGSSQCIRGMVYLALRRFMTQHSAMAQHSAMTQHRATDAGADWVLQNKRPYLLAGRNAHKVLLYTAGVLDFDIEWLYPEENCSYHSCPITPSDLERALQEKEEKPFAVYLTNPDYLGHLVDIGPLAKVCHAHGIPLLVDNAHGAYLHFLPERCHPMDLGADLCCDSGHKTLPVLTGGAYLHVGEGFAEASSVKQALGLFGSTSPSYLIMESLDLANPYLEQLPALLPDFLKKLADMKERLRNSGYVFCGEEPMKLTLDTRAYGYAGETFAGLLEAQNIYCEFADPDYVVLMMTPENNPEELRFLEHVLSSIPKKPLLPTDSPAIFHGQQVMTFRKALMAPRETLPLSACVDRVLATACVSCPPAIPILMSGEQITSEAIARFQYYGIDALEVVKE